MTQKAQQLIAGARKQKRGALDERAGKDLLVQYGVQIPKSGVARDAADAERVLKGLALPVAVKVMSPDILHKSDAGGVRINLRSAADVREAIDMMTGLPGIRDAHIDGWLIEEMAPAGQEIVVGGLHDAQFGPLVMVGLGGIFVEVLADVVFRICPISRLDAAEMLDELKGAAILNGARGRGPVSREAIIDVLLKVGGDGGLLMRHSEDIQEADINPLIVSGAAAIAVDARFILTSPDRTSA